ncbi:DUF3284 domain-containing protein [Spiroplasma endosymbiont of Anurida maritima]|uniref:DUF3284 domain-containing protein n=1 Tax=Spiroplasma endosymbiont of Anurida maritima TaxID=2967972 RepID=UPI0036D421D6
MTNKIQKTSDKKTFEPEDTQELREEFDLKLENINKELYNSRFSESSRIIKLLIKQKLNCDLELVWTALMKQILSEINPNITTEDLSEDNFYRSSKAAGKKFIRVTSYKPNEEFSIEWFSSEAHFTKTIQIAKRGEKTLVTYVQTVKGNKAKANMFEQVLRNNYLKSEFLNFKLTMLKIKKDLNLLSDKKVKNFDIIVNSIKIKISKIRLYHK